MPNRSILAAVILFVACLSLFPAAFAQSVPGLPSVSTAAAKPAAEPADPSLDELISILENETTRARLVEALKASAYRAPGSSGTATEAAAAGAEATDLIPDGAMIVQSLPTEIAASTRAVIGAVTDGWERMRADATTSIETLSGFRGIDLPRLAEAILPVGLVAAVVLAARFLGRMLRLRIDRRLAESAPGTGPIGRLSRLALSGLVRGATIILAWAAGYVAATLFFGGRPGINQALFLNAFLVAEAIKLALALFMAPREPNLRLTPFGNGQADYWYRWIARLVSVLAYTFLFVAPVVESNSSRGASGAVILAVVVLSLALSIGLILKNRGTVRARLKRAKLRGDTSARARLHAFIGQIWWGAAILYLLVLFGAWLRSPEGTFPFMIQATLESIAVMALGGLVVSILERVIRRGITVPAKVKDRLPLFERRLNSIIPQALGALRVLVVALVLAALFHVWSLFSLVDWMRGEVGQRFVGGLVGAGMVLAVGSVIYLAVSSWVEYRLNPNYGTVPTARERTLLSLFSNAFRITLAVIVVMLVLSQIGIDIAPLLAGAGVVGLAVGFGAQKLVQDIITGAFIQLENAMNEGDVVQLGQVSGVVERLTIRSVALRSVDGTYHLLPFSSVDQVSNMTKDFSFFVADVGVAYRENTVEAERAMRDAFAEVKASELGSSIIADFEMMGVEMLSDSAVMLRGRIRTLPGKQWPVGRAYRAAIKRLFDERGIEIPYPNTTLWFGEDKRGKAPALHLKTEPSDESGSAPSPRRGANGSGAGAAAPADRLS